MLSLLIKKPTQYHNKPCNCQLSLFCGQFASDKRAMYGYISKMKTPKITWLG